MMRNIIKSFAGILAGCMMTCTVALAGSPAAIVETFTGDSDVSVYIKGAGVTEGVSVQIGTTEADKVYVQTVSELDVPAQTLVMIDNSLSIPSEDRDRIAEFLQNLISDRLNNEEISIVTFSEEIHVLTDYTNDYGTLKKAVDGITYENQETYLTDVLYDLISQEYVRSDEDVYRRIIVVSDGVDNKSLGYTKDELYSLLKDVRIPVYTIGCVNDKNNDALENMFALSRMSCADSFLLEETEEMLDITNALHQDREVVRLTIVPSEEIMDGSKKAVKILFSDGAVITDEITMPQHVYESRPEEITETLPIETEKPEAETETEPEPEPYAEADAVHWYLLTAAGAAAFAIVLTVIIVSCVLLRKKKGIKKEFETIEENVMNGSNQDAGREDGETEILPLLYDNNSDDGGTFIILDQGTSYQVVLTDKNMPAKTFRVPLKNKVIIGRDKAVCNLVLDYNRSVSKRHCQITVEDGRFYVEDVGSSNGTYLNDIKVSEKSEIFSGNTLRLGRLEMYFEVR